jgi:hypothetical protein
VPSAKLHLYGLRPGHALSDRSYVERRRHHHGRHGAERGVERIDSRPAHRYGDHLVHRRPVGLVVGPDLLSGSVGGAMKRPIMPLAGLLLVMVAVALVAAWNLCGGKLLVMETPSMCPRICVGALVADRPLRGPLHVGEMITFHPPNDFSDTYTHDVWRLLPDGMIQTKGVGEAVHDPWLLDRSDIVGQVEATVWGLGWLLDALPFLSVGVFLWVGARRWISEKWLWEWDMTWTMALVLLPLWSLRPLVRGAIVAIGPDLRHAHWITYKVVNTGVLPVAFTPRGGRSVAHLGARHVATLSGPSPAHGTLMLHEMVSFYWWGWTLIGLFVMAPLAGYFWHLWSDGRRGLAPVSDHPGPSSPPGLLVSGFRDNNETIREESLSGAGTPLAPGAI